MLGGFRTILVDQGRVFRFMTAHQLVKTWYLTALLRPLSFLRCVCHGRSAFLVDQGRRLRFMTAHQLVKTWYLTALLRPLGFLQCVCYGCSTILVDQGQLFSQDVVPDRAAAAAECPAVRAVMGDLVVVLKPGTVACYGSASTSYSVNNRCLNCEWCPLVKSKSKVDDDEIARWQDS